VESSVNSRFREILKALNKNANQFATALGHERGDKIRNFAGKEGYMVNGTVLKEISETFPQINLSWLLAGTGQMLLTDEPKPKEFPDIYSELSSLRKEIEQLKKEVRSK